MVKRLLSLISVVLAMGFVFMSPAAAVEYEPDSKMMVSNDDTTVATAIPIAFNKFDMIELTLSYDDLEKHEYYYYFKSEKHKPVVFSNVQGGGFSLAQAIKAFYI